MLRTLADVGCCGRSSFSICQLPGTVALELFRFVPRSPEMLECVAGKPQTCCMCPEIPCPQPCWCCRHSNPVSSLPPKCHKVALVSLKVSVLLGWRNLSWLGSAAGVDVEFGELCQIVDVPYKQQTWCFLGSLQHLRGVIVLLLTSTLGK